MRPVALLLCSLAACAQPAKQGAGTADSTTTMADSSSPIAMDGSVGVDATGWTAGAAVVEVGYVAGRADFRRLVRYRRASATLELEDSDPFASGHESSMPRVLALRRSLSTADRQRVEQILGRLHPDAAAQGRRCAPGGCLWLARVPSGGAPERLEDPRLVKPVMDDLTRFFPEARSHEP